jgi:hypothetical protein
MNNLVDFVEGLTSNREFKEILSTKDEKLKGRYLTWEIENIFNRER